jgi:hypothetical protein
MGRAKQRFPDNESMMDAGIHRPICFMVQFWGRRYRDYFVDLCLPSLFAPNNLPLLRAADGHRFLIAAPREDWNSIEHLPIMDRLRRYAAPKLIETPPPADNEYVTILRHQTRSLKRLFETAYAYQAFGSAVWPDTILSNGMVAALLRFIDAGHRVVMQPTIRLSEEGVLADLRAMRLMPRRARLSMTAEALNVPPRVVADLSIRHLHPEVRIFEEGHPYQPLHPPYRFWRVPHRNGIILHVFFATPVLMDFTAVPADHAACLDQADWESVYIGRNFSHCGGLHVVRDSDECGILSVTPTGIDRSVPYPTPRFGRRWMPTGALLSNLRHSLAIYTRGQRDAVRRDLFRVSVRWHADEIDDIWRQEEGRISALIERAAGDYYADGRFPPPISLDPRYLPLDLMLGPQYAVKMLGYVRALLRAFAGDRREAARIWRRVISLLGPYFERRRADQKATETDSSAAP